MALSLTAQLQPGCFDDGLAIKLMAERIRLLVWRGFVEL
jgi:hypothetical protein